MPENTLQILVLHGPNLNLLGEREPEVYGHTTLEEINQELIRLGKEHSTEVRCFQSNYEGQMVDCLHEFGKSSDGILINAGALTHYGYSLHDAIVAIAKPTIEVHLSNIHSREHWRRKSVLAPACRGIIAGFGADSYYAALKLIMKMLHKTDAAA